MSLAVGLLVLEGVFRLSFPGKKTSTRKAIVTADDRGHTIFQKNLDLYIPSSETTEPLHVVTNAEGFIGRNYQVAKPEGTFRIALLGDSFVEAIQVDYEMTFPYLLEQELNKRFSATRFEVMNFGVGGQGTMEELWRYHYYVRKYEPDLVIVFFYPNDFENNQYYLEYSGLIQARDPEWVNIQQADANFRQDRRDLKYRLLQTSRLVQYLDAKVRGNAVLSETAIRLGIYDVGVLGSPQADIHPGVFIYQKPLPEAHQIVYNFTYELFKFFREIVERDRSRLMVAYIPEAKQVDEVLWQDISDQLPALRDYSWDLDQPNRLLGEKLAEFGMSFLDLAPEFKKFYRQNPGEYLYLRKGDQHQGHFNEQGHRLVSEILIDFYDRTQK